MDDLFGILALIVVFIIIPMATRNKKKLEANRPGQRSAPPRRDSSRPVDYPMFFEPEQEDAEEVVGVEPYDAVTEMSAAPPVENVAWVDAAPRQEAPVKAPTPRVDYQANTPSHERQVGERARAISIRARIHADTLRDAVVLSEIIGPPKARRRRIV